MEDIIVKAQKRDAQGTASSRRLRHQGWLPGIVYGAGKAGENIQFNQHDFEVMLSHHSSENIMIDLDLEGGKKRKVLLKEVQHHPLTGSVLHADFQEISLTEKLRVEIPLELVGESEGEKTQGGVLEHLLRVVEVECLPGDILEKIELSVEALNIGDGLSVKDIDLDPAKYTVVTDGDIAVAAVAAPRVEEEVVEEGEEEAGAEPEVIGEKKEEEAGDEGGRE